MSLTLRSHCALANPLEDMVSTRTGRRSSSHAWKSPLHATDQEIRAEIIWAQSRLPTPSQEPHANIRPAENDFISSLTGEETERLQHLQKTYGMTKSVVSLNLEPGTGIHVASACSNSPHCFCRLGGVQWLPEFGRWATVRECLSASSFPVSNAALDFCLEGCSRFHDLCPFNRIRSSADLPSRHVFYVGPISSHLMSRVGWFSHHVGFAARC